MASVAAHVFTAICKLTIKRPLVKSPTAETIRRVLGGHRPRVPRACSARNEMLNGVSGEWMIAKGRPAIGTLLYLHGGAYVGCSPVTHRPITSWFAKQGWQVFAPDYRLAPEHRYPAQLQDAMAAYRALLERGVDASRFVVAGDSAGGNLALALCLSLRDQALPLPRAIALFSPVTDFTWSGNSVRDNSQSCAMFTHTIVPVANELFLGEHDPRDPLASPLFADLHGLPPMILQASSSELLYDDSARLADNARRAGIDVQFDSWPVVPHVWQMAHAWIPEGRESLRRVHAFLRRHCT